MKRTLKFCAALLALLLCMGCTLSSAQQKWTYSIEYYINGVLHEKWTSSGTVPADSPVVTDIDTRLLALPNFSEYPVTKKPYMLRHDGEVIRVDYVERSLIGYL
ncbi:MAG: hypothetical protein EOM30_07140 [Clostridia bacterium]|jgi:hypothetical protein|nr:hypothetical protein [Clostridia bacterium]NLS85668.1 hypothetical protein [Oscillospiraceae bacterium]